MTTFTKNGLPLRNEYRKGFLTEKELLDYDDKSKHPFRVIKTSPVSATYCNGVIHIKESNWGHLFMGNCNCE